MMLFVTFDVVQTLSQFSLQHNKLFLKFLRIGSFHENIDDI